MAENGGKNIILERIILTDPITKINTASAGSCIGMLGIGIGDERTCYQCVENMLFTFLKVGTYKLGLYMASGGMWKQFFRCTRVPGVIF